MSLFGRHLLIVDDDAELREIVRCAFERRGVVVQEAAHGGVALAAIASGVPFDLVITDVRMPKVNGLELLDRTRARGLATPFIVITAFSDEEVRKEVMRFEAARLLDKPFDFTELVDLAKEMLTLSKDSGTT